MMSLTSYLICEFTFTDRKNNMAAVKMNENNRFVNDFVLFIIIFLS